MTEVNNEERREECSGPVVVVCLRQSSIENARLQFAFFVYSYSK